MGYTFYRDLAQVPKRVRLAFAAMNLKMERKTAILSLFPVVFRPYVSSMLYGLPEKCPGRPLFDKRRNSPNGWAVPSLKFKVSRSSV